MGDAGAAVAGGQESGPSAGLGEAAAHRRDPMASSDWRAMAGCSRAVRTVADGVRVVSPLAAERSLGARILVALQAHAEGPMRGRTFQRVVRAGLLTTLGSFRAQDRAHPRCGEPCFGASSADGPHQHRSRRSPCEACPPARTGRHRNAEVQSASAIRAPPTRADRCAARPTARRSVRPSRRPGRDGWFR